MNHPFLSQRVRYFTSFFVIVVAAGYVCRLASSKPSTRSISNEIDLTFDQYDVDIGDLWEATPCSKLVLINNPGDTAINIDDVQAECSCSVVASRFLQIPAHSKCAVPIEINSSRPSDGADSEQWPFRTRLTLISSKFKKGRRYFLRGRTLAHPVAHLNFDSVRSSDSNSLNQQQGNVIFAGFSLRHPAYTVQPSVEPSQFFEATATNSRRERWRLSIRSLDDAPAGKHRVDLKLLPLVRSGEEIAPLKHSFTFDVSGPIRVVPDTILLPPIRIGETAETELIISPDSPEHDFRFQRLEYTSDRVEIVGSILDTERLRLQVTMKAETNTSIPVDCVFVGTSNKARSRMTIYVRSDTRDTKEK